MAEQIKISKRILGILLNSISAGVVPRVGLEYIAIGRNDEVNAFLGDLENIADGMCAFKFIIGRYGSGKSFLLQLVRNHAADRGFVTADADLSPERRLSGTKGQGIATYRELIKSFATKASPDGGALPVILSKWFTEIGAEAINNGAAPDSQEFSEYVRKRIFEVASGLESMVNGFDFAKVLCLYYDGVTEGDETKTGAAIKWLRGEYSTKLEARSSLSVASIINDENWYDYIKLFSVFVRKIGYKGLVIFLDECVNLYKIPNRVSRENNYEKILAIFNDTMQGKAEGLAFYLAGMPEFLEDRNRGLYSYEALRSRLADSRFLPKGDFKNYLSPVLRLSRLTDDELYALICKLYNIHSLYHKHNLVVTDEEKITFLRLYGERMGADSLLTPREVIRDFLTVLNIMHQNPGMTFTDIVSSRAFETEPEEDEFDEAFAEFTL